MAFQSKNVEVSTDEVTLYECPSANEGSAHSLVVSSSSSTTRKVSLRHYDHSEGTTTALLTDLEIAKGTPYAFPKALNLNPGDKLLAVADGSGVTVYVGVYLAASASSASFNPRGAWQASANYVRLDVVSYAGSSYLALSASVNDPPPSGNWMLLAAEGPAGSNEWVDILNKPTTFTPTTHSHAEATTDTSGFMPPSAVTKLASLENYNHPTADGSHHVPATGTTNNGKFLKAGAAEGSEAWATLAVGDVSGLQTQMDAKAPLASPTFTGTPVAPTATAGTNTTQLATTEFVTSALAAKAPTTHSHAEATTDRVGFVELATTDETAAGTDATRAVTPAGLAGYTSGLTDIGTVDSKTDYLPIYDASAEVMRKVHPSSLGSSIAQLHAAIAAFM